METTQAAEQFQFILDAGLVTILIAVVIPAITSFLTRLDASKQLKAGINIVLAGVASWVASATVEDGSAVFTKEGAIVFGMGIVSAMTSYYLGWKPTGVADVIQIATAGKGLGGNKVNSELMADQIHQMHEAA